MSHARTTFVWMAVLSAGTLVLGMLRELVIAQHLQASASADLFFRGVVVVGALLFSAWQHFELLRHGYRQDEVQRERAAEAEINRHLRLEIDTLRSPARIEKLATRDLHMVSPGPDEASVIERVLPASAPPSSVVARR